LPLATESNEQDNRSGEKEWDTPVLGNVIVVNQLSASEQGSEEFRASLLRAYETQKAVQSSRDRQCCQKQRSAYYAGNE
jgi:hypothetical protein